MVVTGTNGIFSQQSFPVDRGALIFGRNSMACNVVFPDHVKGISRVHCKIEGNGTNFTITDLGSSYGTFVNGLKIQPNVPTALKNGDTFYMGDKSNMFSVSGNSGMGNGVSYVGSEEAEKNRETKGIMIVGIVAIAILLVGIMVVTFITIKSSNKANQMERMIRNSNPITEFFFEVIEDAIY